MTVRFDPELLPAAPNLEFELALWRSGIELLAGIDEAGRGALAGPVVAAAVVLPNLPDLAALLEGVRDSKELSPEKRSTLAGRIKQTARAWGVGFAASHEIDQFGILTATRTAASRAVHALLISPQHLLIDCLFLPDHPAAQTSLIKGDARSLSIAAASILAKTARDQLMLAMHGCYPAYHFDEHKGYGTQAHLRAILQNGPCPIHRSSFHPLKKDPSTV